LARLDGRIRAKRRDVARPWAAGAPADRLGSLRGEDSHGCRASGRQCPEPPLVATIEPAGGELAASHAERHAPAAAGSPLTLEQSRQVSHVFRSHGPSVDVCSHEQEATQTRSQPTPSAGVGEASLVYGSGADPKPRPARAKLARQDDRGRATMRRESLRMAKIATNRRVNPSRARWKWRRAADSLVAFQSILSHLHDCGGMREGAGKVGLLASPLSRSTNRTEFPT